MRLRIGSRGSPLALWQAEHVAGWLRERGHQVDIRVIVTTGDRVLDRRLEAVGGKGAFLKEIEEALLAGEVDLAVHSLKDVPVALPEGLRVCAVLERADARDALVSASGLPLAGLPAGSRIGTTSLRRAALVHDLRPDLVVEDLRGNVETRLRRLREGRFDAVVLAMAGLGRLGRAAEVTEALDPAVFVPAPGQGAIAVECRSGDDAVAEAVAPLHHELTGRAVAAERAYLAALGGGCNVPLGAHVVLARAELRLVGFVAEVGGARRLWRGEAWGRDPEALGRALADQVRARGAPPPSVKGPLRGRRIVVTRRREQSDALVASLRALGAEVASVPLIELRPPADPAPLEQALARLDTYQWLVLASANAADAVADRWGGRPLPPALRLASVGPSTTAAIAERFRPAPLPLQPAERFQAEGLLEAFMEVALTGARVLLPQSERARPVLAEGLRRRGAVVDAVPAYGVTRPEGAAAALAAELERGVDLVALASPSAVDEFLAAAGERAPTVATAVIGPVTEAAARAAGLDVRVVASPATADGVVAAIVRAVGTD